MTQVTIKSLRQQDHEHDLLPPPDVIRVRLLPELEQLTLDWRAELPLKSHERRFRRNIVRWIMADARRAESAARALPAGYVIHAWMTDDPAKIVVMRTR